MVNLFEVGDQVTIGPPYDDLPYICSFRRHVRVATVGEVFVTVELTEVSADLRFQQVPAWQLRHGWLDSTGWPR